MRLLQDRHALLALPVPGPKCVPQRVTPWSCSTQPLPLPLPPQPLPRAPQPATAAAAASATTPAPYHTPGQPDPAGHGQQHDYQ